MASAIGFQADDHSGDWSVTGWFRHRKSVYALSDSGLFATGIAFLLLLISSMDAHAANCSPYPYTLQNGQTADANQVMANFNNIMNCANNNLPASPVSIGNGGTGATDQSTARANLGLGAASTENLGASGSGAVKDDGAGNLTSTLPTIHSQVFTVDGTFTIPSNATSETVFKFTVIGGGGGGGGPSGSTPGNGGASGGAVISYFTGFTAGTTVTVTIGTGGAGGSTGQNGVAGTETMVLYNSAEISYAEGGSGGGIGDLVSSAIPGTYGASSGGGASLVTSYSCGAQYGFVAGESSNASGAGGGNCVGTAGGAVTGTAGLIGVWGAGGSGAGISHPNGGNGGNGEVIVEWTL